MIKLVSEQDPKKIAMLEAKQKLSAAINSVAANILRIIAGAGKADALIDQIALVLAANEKLVDLAGNALASRSTIEQALRSLDWRSDAPGYNRASDEDLARW